MAIYKPKILFFCSTESKGKHLDKYGIFYDIIKTDTLSEAVSIAFKELHALSAIIIDDAPDVDLFYVLSKFHSLDAF